MGNTLSKVYPNAKNWIEYSLLTDSNKYSDISFVIGNKTIGAHKAIINVKSSQLAQLFANNTSNQIIINNMEYSKMYLRCIQRDDKFYIHW